MRAARPAPSANRPLKRHQEELAELLAQAFSAEIKLDTKRKSPARRKR